MDPASLSGLSASQIAMEYSVKVLKAQHDEADAEGQAAVSLIQSASPRPPPPSGGKGSLLNTYA